MLKYRVALASLFAMLAFPAAASSGWICLNCAPTPDPAPIHQGGWCLHCS